VTESIVVWAVVVCAVVVSAVVVVSASVVAATDVVVAVVPVVLLLEDDLQPVSESAQSTPTAAAAILIDFISLHLEFFVQGYYAYFLLKNFW
jgi:hypothetical protein